MTKELKFRPCDLHISKWDTKTGFSLTSRTNGIDIIHLPTGIRASCDEHRSEHRNKDEAMKMLKKLMVECNGVTQASIWQHTNSTQYMVIGFANSGTTNPDKYPLTVIYRNTSNGSTWSRPVSDWFRSMTEVKDDE
jgi:hypothetical protein